MRWPFVVCMTILLVLSRDAVAAGPKIEPFRLPGINQDVVELKNEQDGITVVCFLGTECPLAKLYGPRLAQLAEAYRDKHVSFVGINSNSQDSKEEVLAYAQKYSLNFPVAKDYGNVVADSFAAKRTPEVFVLDADRNVVYRGRIDDQYAPGVSRQAATRHDLRNALDQVLSNKPVSCPLTLATGCFIGREREPIESSDVTFTNQVARIFHKQCVECHRPQEIGPFSLLDYEESIGWADTILEVIDDGRMPPWHANPQFGHFINARHLSAEEKVLLHEWVEAGTPYGDPQDLPEQPSFSDGWRLSRDPDVVLTMSDQPFTIPAEGTVEYQYFVVDPGFEEDKWVTGAQVLPGNHSVVHHSIVFVRPPDGAEFRGIGWLTAYVPGNRSGAFETGHAIKVPAGSKLVFQQHYTPTGIEQTDQTKVGITFGDASTITHEIYTLAGIDQEFEIPPHAANHQVKSHVPYLPQHATLLSIMPHMHVRGKSFTLYHRSDDEETVLLDVPQYDFNWQHAYELVEPIPLSQVDSLEFTISFDNSKHNPANPNPAEHVTWGDQTWEEMAVAFFVVSEPRVKQALPKTERSSNDRDISPEHQKRMKAEADRMLVRFDKNRDGVVTRYETPLAFRNHSFWDIDKNRDGKLTRPEIEQAARWRVRE